MAIKKENIIKYIEDCHLSDGGYFFAKVEPSSGLETYLAVKTLRLLGTKPEDVKSVMDFWQDGDDEGRLDDPFSIFLAVGTYKELGVRPGVFKKYTSYLADYYRQCIRRTPNIHSENKKAIKKEDPLSGMNYLDTVGKELGTLFYLVSLRRDLKIKIVDKDEVIRLVVAMQNKNGGFGQGRESHLMATYHALSILNILNAGIPEIEKLHKYLISKWHTCSFLEDLFCIVESLSIIKKLDLDCNEVISFVDSCQRNNGGFGRAPVLSIPTIEDTYKAVKIIKTCDVKYLFRK